jgi:Zn finger protein HypA/HybF involved in hydrogenase expression
MNAADTPYTYLGNFSAVDPAYSRGMACHECRVEWTGCWDNFQCPKCGEGELPYIGDAANLLLKWLKEDGA